jgi:hypothetical protein
VQALFELLSGDDKDEDGEDGGSNNENLYNASFESVDTGTIPSGWVTHGNSDTTVTDSVSTVGTNSLRMSGSSGGCWETTAFGEIGQDTIPDGNSDAKSDKVNISFDVRPMGQADPGCHGNTNTVVLLNSENTAIYGDKENNQHLIKFHADGTVEGTIGGGVDLGTYSVGEWIDVTMTYNRQSDAALEVTYYINDGNRGTATTEEILSSKALSHLHVNTGEYTTYMDNIQINSTS